jgi:trimethylamine--corrinoid protein Co-methyltransferase
MVDQQAALEAALTLLVDVQNGCHLVHDLGYLEGGLSGSLEMLALCDETVGWIKRLRQGLEINEETLALDLIAKVGPDGQFLDQEHTLAHVREDWMPDLVDRQLFENWAEAGELSLKDRANRKVREILEAPPAHELPPAIRQKVMDVVESAGRR